MASSGRCDFVEGERERIVARPTDDEMDAHRRWLDEHDEQPDPECHICEEMVRRGR